MKPLVSWSTSIISSFYTPPLVALTEKGLFCEAGGFYIDPHRAVDLAVVTHAHSDHARRGSRKYICVSSGIGLLRSRLGKKIEVDGYAYGEIFQLGDVTVSLHSAGHILGSAQVRIQRGNEVWVASGDYKRDPDPSCDPFETVACDTFITEATFGTPKYAWDRNAKHGEDMARWWNESRATGKNCILYGYSLGKAQRILAELAPFAETPILIHSSISELTECYRVEGRVLAPTRDLLEALRLKDGEYLAGEFILAPPSIRDESWFEKLGDYETAFASGWMQGNRSTFGGRYDRGFVLSDHADWAGLNQTIRETGAKRVFVQHREGALIRHLRKQGIEAHPVDELRVQNYERLGGSNLELF